jgi:UPF0716 protein FxsA
MPLLLIVLFIVVPIAELAVIIQVGSWIGFWWTLALLVADSVLGAMLMRSQGRAAWRRFNAAVAEGRAPTREVLDGVLVIFGGALLLTPGFLTDVVGLLFLFPPTRVLVRGLLVRRASLRMMRASRPPHSREQDVDGHAVDIEPDQLDRPR